MIEWTIESFINVSKVTVLLKISRESILIVLAITSNGTVEFRVFT